MKNTDYIRIATQNIYTLIHYHTYHIQAIGKWTGLQSNKVYDKTYYTFFIR